MGTAVSAAASLRLMRRLAMLKIWSCLGREFTASHLCPRAPVWRHDDVIGVVTYWANNMPHMAPLEVHYGHERPESIHNDVIGCLAPYRPCRSVAGLVRVGISHTAVRYIAPLLKCERLRELRALGMWRMAAWGVRGGETGMTDFNCTLLRHTDVVSA